jgi:Bacterial Ig-like domain (group 2)
MKPTNWTAVFLYAVLSSLLLTLPGCGGASSDRGSSGAVTLISFDILPTSPSIQVGDTQQFTARAHFSNGTSQDVTDKADWSSSALDIADIESTFDIEPGLAHGKAVGTTTITVTLPQDSKSVTSSTTLTVSPTLTGIDISPLSPSLHVGDFLQFTGTAHFSDGTTRDVTDEAFWSSSALDIADIQGSFDIEPGVAEGKAAGKTTITASFNQGSISVMSSTDLTVVAGATSSTSRRPGRVATVSFLVEPGASTSGLKADGRMLPNFSDGGASSVKLPPGRHLFTSPDGRHIFAIILEGQRTYSFQVLDAGGLALRDAEAEAP